ncbi:MAG: type I glyceraldehyde-3-phosphate dehydrogenase [Chloroflexi bacterium 13_1_40CM_4_68_4]|nr:MAG: type I glyceraldehyde-3-phosphate dehydrogenase [Chloroflexi bacterium 13_1_40CM_4_68_4]
MARIAINGFGRIGRQSLKAILERQRKLEVIAVNDLADPTTNAFLFKHDSNYGTYPGEVSATTDALVVDGRTIKVFAEKEPGKLPWKELGIDIVIESTGFFTDATKAKAHRDAGARKVIISAPAKNEDITVVLGVNERSYDPEKHHVISNASCTTNGLAPVAKILHERFGIRKGLLTTIHAYTNSQKLLDLVAKDPRDARAAAINIVPNETGAARAIGLVIPDLAGRFTGMAFRVPVSTVSVVDFTAQVGREVTKEEINGVFKEAAAGTLQGILGYTEEPLVSSDLKGDSRSSIFSALDTIVLGDMVKVISWYDNEWGYACRIADITAYVAERLPAAVAA